MTDGLSRLDDWPDGARAGGWVRRDGTAASAGEVDRAFRLASVTKLLTAAAVLVATQEEILALDDQAGPPGSTVRLLLCHASGLPFDGQEPIAPPGERRIYGNAAFEVLGELVAERAGMPFADYVGEGVCRPLAMGATTVSGSPAHGASSTVTDLLRLGAELLSPGTLLDPATVAEATAAQLPDLAGVLPGFGRQSPNPWGLGFELHGTKSPHWMPETASPAAFGHFGQAGGFLWVDPEAGVACATLSDVPFGEWAQVIWPIFGEEVLQAATPR